MTLKYIREELVLNKEDATSSLGIRVRVGLGLNVGSLIITQLIGLVRSIIVARLLFPDDYGLFGLATTVMTGFGALTNVGLDTALIVKTFQNEDNKSRYIDTIWTVDLIRRLILVIMLLASVYPTVKFFGDIRLYSIIPMMALTPLILGFQNIGLVLARKQLDFRRIVVYEQVSNIVNSVVVVSLAFWVRDVQALVFGSVLGIVVTVCLSYVFHPYRPKFVFDKLAFQNSFQFGKWLFVISIMTYITTTADNIAIGKISGAEDLGVYVLAYGLASLPVGMIFSVFGTVMMPAYAELRNQPVDRLEHLVTRAFLLAICLLTVVFLPMLLFTRELILTLYGMKWIDAVPLVRILVFLGFLRGMANLFSPLSISMNKPEQEAKAKIVEASIFVALLWLFVPRYGSIGGGWAGVITYFVAFIIRLSFVSHFAPRAAYRAPSLLLMTLLIAACSGSLTFLLVSAINVDLWRLILGGIVSVVLTVLGMVGFHPLLRGEAKRMFVPVAQIGQSSG